MKIWRWKFFALLLPVVPIMLAWNQFIVPSGTHVSDILISHYPNLLLIQRSLASGDGFPLWSPLILSGYPLDANPLSTLWYPPAWISLLFSLPLGINLVMAIHIIIGVAGYWQLLRRLNLSTGITFLGSILFGFLPAGYAHIIAGHFTWSCAAAWFPWLAAFSIQKARSKWEWISLPAFCFGLMMLADLRFSAYAGAFWIILLAARMFINTPNHSRRDRLIPMIRAGGIVVLAAGMSAIVWLPLLEYTGASTRVLMGNDDIFYLSLPPVQLTGLVVPGHPTSMEWIFYPGSVCLLLGMIAYSFIKEKRDLWVWTGLSVLFLLWSFGDAIPVNRWLVGLPGLSLLRVPARGLYFFNFALLTGAMISLDHLIEHNPEKAVFLRLSTLFFTILVILLQVFIIVTNPEKNGFLIWHVIFWIIAASLILLYSYRKITAKLFLLGVFTVAISDAAFVCIRLMDRLPVTEALSLGQAEARYVISEGKNTGRIFSPSYSIPQQTAAFWGLEIADGIDPLQLRTYSNFIHDSNVIVDDNYSVTLPPFKSGDPSIDNIDIKPDARALGLLNIHYLVSSFPIKQDGWSLSKQLDHAYIYENPMARGWAWLENEDDGESYLSIGNDQISRHNNRITIQTTGPGKLVTSEIIYPGWQVWVDGKLAQIQPAYTILRSVSLEGGPHKVEFVYYPVTLIIGAIVSLVSILIIFLLSKKTIAYA